MKTVVEIFWLVVGGYFLLGLGFTVVFHARGLHVVDPATQGAGLGFRLLITPGMAALWPLLAWRWREQRRGNDFLGGSDQPVSPRRLRALQRLAWRTLLVWAPLLMAAGWLWRASPIPPTPLPVQGSRGPLIVNP